MESPVVKQLAEASRSLDISSLRFDWRGIGGSSGTPSGETADADLDFGTQRYAPRRKHDPMPRAGVAAPRARIVPQSEDQHRNGEAAREDEG